MFKKYLSFLAFAFSLSACDLGYQNGSIWGNGTTTSGGTLQVIPSSTSVAVNQSMSFQVAGGTSPYQFQLSGVGSIDSTGNYQAGATPGQSQIQVTDSVGNTGSATVSVVQVTSSIAADWQPSTTTSKSKTTPSAPLVQGQLVGTSENKLDNQGDSIQSQFIKTNLKHPLIREDELIEKNQEVAERAVVEDQFVVTLQTGYTQLDLQSVLNKANAHISKQLEGNETYLVAMGKKGDPSVGQNLTADFLNKRAQLKKLLQSVGVVSPEFVLPDTQNR